MKLRYFFLPIALLPVILMLSAYSGGSPGAKTGSPLDGNKCTQCHSGTANTATGWITTNIPEEGYTAGETYTITVTGTHTGVVKFGFELTSEASEKVGTWVITDDTQTQLANSSQSVTHKSTGNTPSGDSKTWSVDWTAPSDVGEDVVFYAAFNAANGNGNNSGDQIYTTSLTVSEFENLAAVTGITPTSGQQGQEVETVITGEFTDWMGSEDVVLTHESDPSGEIMASVVFANSDTELEAVFEIDPDEPVGMYNLTVGDALPLLGAFEVLHMPVVTGLTPGSGQQGDIIEATVTGEYTSWTGEEEVTLNHITEPSGEISGINVSAVSATELAVTFEIDLDEPVGLYNLSVEGAEGLSSIFVVTAAASVTGIDPASGEQGQTISASIDGMFSSWTGGEMVELQHVDNASTIITGTNVMAISATELSVDFEIGTDDPLGIYNVYVEGAIILMEGFEVMESTVGIGSSLAQNLKLYPNPASDQVVVESIADGKLEIYSHAGQLIKTENLVRGSHIIDVSAMEAGLYFLRIHANEELITKKLLVQ